MQAQDSGPVTFASNNSMEHIQLNLIRQRCVAEGSRNKAHELLRGGSNDSSKLMATSSPSTTTGTDDSQSQSQSQGTSSSLQKRVRLSLNGVQALPGSSSLDSLAEASPRAASPKDVESDADVSGSDGGKGEKKRGRGPSLAPEEAKRRRRERNRVAAANKRRTQAEQTARLEKEVKDVRDRMASLQRYVYDLEGVLKENNIVLPSRSPMCSSRRLRPTDNVATDNADAAEVTDTTSSPSPVQPVTPPVRPPRGTKRRRNIGPAASMPAMEPISNLGPVAVNITSDAHPIAPNPLALVPNSRSLMAAPPVPPKTPDQHMSGVSTTRPFWSMTPRNLEPMITVPTSAQSNSDSFQPFATYHSGPVTPVSAVRDTNPSPPIALPNSQTTRGLRTPDTSSQLSSGTSCPSVSRTYRQTPLPNANPIQPTPTPPTPSTLEALQLELRLKETLEQIQQHGFEFPTFDLSLLPDDIASAPLPVFTGGDDYDSMSLSALFNLEGLDDDPNDTNFEPTSPKASSSDDEEEDSDEEEGESDEEDGSPRKRARTQEDGSVSPPDSHADEDRDMDDEDLFLPIEDVPIPPPLAAAPARPPTTSLDEMYGEVMAILGVTTREELQEAVTKLFTTINSREKVTPTQLEALKQIMRIFHAKGQGHSGVVASGSGNEIGSGSGRQTGQHLV